MRKHDLILLLVLTLAGAWKWSPVIGSDAVLPDEQPQVDAAQSLAAGLSPYDEPGYFYPPPIAALICALTPRVGEIGALRLLRFMALAGLVITAWLALRQVSWPRSFEIGTAVAFFLVSPPVDIATSLGNVAGLVSGLVLYGLVGWQRRPYLAGVALGLGLALKPIAPAAPLLLALHRPQPTTRNHQIAAVVSVATAAVVCLPHLRFLPGLLTNALGDSHDYNFSLYKLLSDLDLTLPAPLIAAAVTAIAIVILRRSVFDSRSVLAVIVTSNLFALPILWAHSMLLLLPIQLLAIDSAVATWRSRGPFPAVRFKLLILLAVAGVASTLLSHAVGTTHGLPAWSAPVVRAVPLLAIPYLGWFVPAAAAIKRRDEGRGETAGSAVEVST